MIGFEREDARACSRLLEAEVLFEPNMAIARRTRLRGTCPKARPHWLLAFGAVPT
jgi:hypothetical protein